MRPWITLCCLILTPHPGFQQDTFPTDSLSHILALLSSFDAQSYTLLSSISLTNHSRVKDLWIFMGPPLVEDLCYQDSPASSILDASHGELKRQVHSPDLIARPQTGVPPHSPSHRKFATEPDLVHLPPSPSAKIDFDDHRLIESRSSSSAGPSNTLRKHIPRAQPSNQRMPDKLYDVGVRAILPSTISSDVENMTGVGAGIGRFSPRVCYPSPYGGMDAAGKPISPDLPVSTHAPPRSRSITPSHQPYSLLHPVSTHSKTPELLGSHSPSPSLSSPHGDAISNTPSSALPGSGRETPPLLGPGAFRDSAFSSSSQATYYGPIKAHDLNAERDQEDIERSRPFVEKRSSSMGVILPGGWQPSPVEEEPEVDIGMDGAQSPADDSDRERGPETPVHEVGSRVSSPELNRPDSKLRKSEAAVVGMIVNPLPPPPRLGQDKRKDSSSSGTGQGWVLVNVDGMVPPSPVEKSVTRDTGAISRSLEPPSPTSANWNGLDKSRVARSHEAQALVVIDAMNVSKKSKSKPKSTVVGLDGKKTLFGLGRKDSVSVSTSSSMYLR